MISIHPRFCELRCYRRLSILVVAASLTLGSHALVTPSQNVGAANGNAQLPVEMQAQLAQLQSTLQSAVVARDAHTAAKTLNQLGSLWLSAGNRQNAQEAFNHALEAAKLSKDAEQGVAALNGLATIARMNGNMPEAMQAYQQALEVATAQGVIGGKADALFGLALVASSQKQSAQALDYANQALAVRRGMGDHAGEAAILAEIATRYSAVGEKQKALDYAQQAHDAYRAAGDHRGEAMALIGIGDIYMSIRDRKATDEYAQALDLARQLNFPRIQGWALNKMGMVEQAKGEYQKALDDFNQALPIFQRMNMTDAIGGTLMNIGAAWSSLGEAEKALDYYNQALPMIQSTGDRDGEAVLLNNMGRIYQGLGDNKKAIEYYSQAAPLLIAAGDRAMGVLLLDNIGAAYVELGETQKALGVLNQVLSLQTGLPNRRSEALARMSMGMAYHKQGDNQKALESMNQGLSLVKQVDDRANEARAHTALAKIYLDMGDNAKGLANLNEALPLAKAMNDPLILAPILYGMMQAHKLQPALAIFYGKQAVNLLQQVRSNMQGLDKELQSTFVTSKSAFYHDLADLLIDQGRLPEAEEIIDLMKQQQLNDFTRDETKEATRPVSLSAEEQKLEDAYEGGTKDLIANYEAWTALDKKTDLSDAEKKKKNDLEQLIEQGSTKFEDLLDHLDTVLQAAEKQKLDRARDDVPGLANLVSELDPQTVMLYTLVTEDRYRVIVIRNNHALVERSTAIKSADLSHLVVQFVDLMSHPGDTQQLTAVSSKLYAVLIAPIEADLAQAHAHTLVWELDDVLHYIPMAALYDPQAKQFLVEKYANAIITPTSISMLEKTPNVKNATMLAMGISSQYDEHFVPLKNVPVELGSIVHDPKVSDTHGPVAGTEWLNNDFTAANLKEQLKSGRYQLVHLASHFDAQASGDATKSFLLVAGDETGGGSGFHLTLDALRHDPGFRMNRVELLTFSACKTAVAAKATDGHEVDGLAGVGHKLGAKAVMASLWEVDDASTAELMGDFYQRWAGGDATVSKVEALRQAQLDMLLGKDRPQTGAASRGFGNAKAHLPEPEGYAHPHYWAPFILMGNWR
jgi:CHAT domain-containing protein/Tfp pilus assembly protein PilF